MLSELHKKILTEIDNLNGHGLLRMFLTREELKACNLLVKSGHLTKGKNDERGATVAFFITEKGLDSI